MGLQVCWFICTLVYISGGMHINDFFILWVFEMIGKSIHLSTCGYLRLYNGLQACWCIYICMSVWDDLSVISGLWEGVVSSNYGHIDAFVCLVVFEMTWTKMHLYACNYFRWQACPCICMHVGIWEYLKDYNGIWCIWMYVGIRVIMWMDCDLVPCNR